MIQHFVCGSYTKYCKILQYTVSFYNDYWILMLIEELNTKTTGNMETLEIRNNKLRL